jgi:hypothetical protein
MALYGNPSHANVMSMTKHYYSTLRRTYSAQNTEEGRARHVRKRELNKRRARKTEVSLRPFASRRHLHSHRKRRTAVPRSRDSARSMAKTTPSAITTPFRLTTCRLSTRIAGRSLRLPSQLIVKALAGVTLDGRCARSIGTRPG